MRTDPLPTPPELAHAGVSLRLEEVFPGDHAKGLVPSYHFRIFNEDQQEVGHLNFRVDDNPHILEFAGHIGYAIRPQFRGRRYALRACQAVAPFVAAVSGSVIITADVDNIPSLRTIERLGCECLGDSLDPLAVPRISRGCRPKKRYRWTPQP